MLQRVAQAGTWPKPTKKAFCHLPCLLLARQECLERQDMEKWIPTNLNRLCYAIGSISGAMQARGHSY